MKLGKLHFVSTIRISIENIFTLYIFTKYEYPVKSDYYTYVLAIAKLITMSSFVMGDRSLDGVLWSYRYDPDDSALRYELKVR